MSSIEELARAYDARARTYGGHRPRRFDEFRDRALDAFVAALPGPRVLDLGSGPGHEAVDLRARGADVTAVDISEGMLEQCADRGFATVRGDMRRVDELVDGSVDGLWCSFSLLHLPKVEARDVVERAARALSPDGVLAILLFRGTGEGPRESDVSTFGTARYFAYYEPDELTALVEPSFAPISLDTVEISPRPSLALIARKVTPIPEDTP